MRARIALLLLRLDAAALIRNIAATPLHEEWNERKPLDAGVGVLRPSTTSCPSVLAGLDFFGAVGFWVRVFGILFLVLIQEFFACQYQ